MLKYDFLVFHKEYQQFLEGLQELGVLHVAGKEVEITEEIRQKYREIEQIEKAIQFLAKREVKPEGTVQEKDAAAVLTDLAGKQAELETLLQELEETKKELQKAEPWGTFSPELLQKLKGEEIDVQFLVTGIKRFEELAASGLPVEMISERGSQVYAVLIQQSGEKTEPEPESVRPPALPFPEVQKKLNETEDKINSIHSQFDEYAGYAIPLLENMKNEISSSLDYELVFLNTSVEAEEKLMILEGWAPAPQKDQIDRFAEDNHILYISSKATPGDTIPVLLKNNRFSRLFEPIGKMFSLPDYHELDLTVFFAPFFMMFFGFCLGDAGYGLLFLIGAGLYKFKAPEDFKPYLSLVQILGLATIIFGTISGTFFGINLIQADIPMLDNVRNLFLNPDKMFYLAIVLGALQIIFGLFIKAGNQTKQYGFSYALSTIGWLIVLLGSVIYVLLTKTGVIQPNQSILYAIISLGVFFILFFSDPGVNVFSRIGKGVWDIYSTVTGIFGDLLSYIRLFALGLSSGILGFVINDIGLQILGSSKILGPVFFVVFLILGHTLNILISSLGSFVHPMRLTFVEFYKNAGFKGGGGEYKPFSK
jgi:V/A-type H+-transporting ATPase subunit I